MHSYFGTDRNNKMGRIPTPRKGYKIYLEKEKHEVNRIKFLSLVLNWLTFSASTTDLAIGKLFHSRAMQIKGKKY